MSLEPLFTRLDSAAIANLISTAKESVCYAGPGIQMPPAQAICAAAKTLGPEMVTVCIDFDERVMRMGYGDLKAVKLLTAAGIVVRSAPGLRTALIIVDGEGFIFTPNALYLEAEAPRRASANALRLSSAQVAEALARLSPAAKQIAKLQAATDEQRNRIDRLPVEVDTTPISPATMATVTKRLEEVPPVNFDVARQVRVYNAYFQYVELRLTGVAIQRHRLAIPPEILRFGGSRDLEDRLHTTFDLIKKDDALSSKKLEEELRNIRNAFTRPLGREHGRVVLKSVTPKLEERLKAFRKRLTDHQASVAARLQNQLNESRKQIKAYYLPRVIKSPPDVLLGQLMHDRPTEADALHWLEIELSRAFPKADNLIKKMRLEISYKDVTFDTLNKPGFLESIRNAYPNWDWNKAYEEFRAAGEVAGFSQTS